MGHFNEVVGDDLKMMATVLLAGKLTDVHTHKHEHVNIATYIWGWRRVNYQYEYNYEEVEKLDELITIGMLCAKQKCKNHARLPWSEEIHKKMTQVNIHWLYISSLCNKVDCIDQIEKKEHTLKVNQDLPTTVKETGELLKAAQKQVQTMWKVYQSKRRTF